MLFTNDLVKETMMGEKDGTIGNQTQQAFLGTMDDQNLDPAEMLERGTSQQQVGEMGAETSVEMQNADNQNTVSKAQADAQASSTKDNEKNKEKVEDTATNAADSQVNDATELEGGATKGVSNGVGSG
jgi:hypothetical protein